MKAAAPISRRDRILGGLWGSLVGDSLGVPVEFHSRAEVQQNPVTGLREFGTHHQPRGTWSDDGALILCTVDSLVGSELDIEDMGRRFIRWMNQGLWTATGDVFDVGLTTTDALLRIADGSPAEDAGGRDEHNNGNGSLMRIIPVALRFAEEPCDVFAQRLERVSAITHGHPRAKMACALFGFVISGLLEGLSPKESVTGGRQELSRFYEGKPELASFRSLLNDDFPSLPEDQIASGGFVLHTLHAALWCLLTTQDYRECVLKAVNLGDDTDTAGCVAGGLAGVAYGLGSIPSDWIAQLARRDDVDRLFQKLADVCSSPPTRERSPQ
jgi:ADP-ribosylglycohydrolase